MIILVLSDLHLGKGKFLKNGQLNLLEDFLEDEKFFDFCEYYSKGDYEKEYRVVLANGGERWIAARGRIEYGAGGKPLLMRGVLLDITTERQSANELQQLRGQLAHAGRVSMMGQLATALAHELNQPLGAILRNAEAAELFMQHENPNLDEVRAIISDIRKDDQREEAPRALMCRVRRDDLK